MQALTNAFTEVHLNKDVLNFCHRHYSALQMLILLISEKTHSKSQWLWIYWTEQNDAKEQSDSLFSTSTFINQATHPVAMIPSSLHVSLTLILCDILTVYWKGESFETFLSYTKLYNIENAKGCLSSGGQVTKQDDKWVKCWCKWSMILPIRHA